MTSPTPSKPRGQTKTIIATILIVLIAIVAFQNWESVSIEFLFATVTMPKLFWIITTFLAGVAFGWLTRKRRRG